MATATKIHLDAAKDTGVFSSGVHQDAAHAASRALQDDMEKHHVFFNDEGFHSMSISNRLISERNKLQLEAYTMYQITSRMVF